MIEKVVNLLKHKNPYTGKTYAEEPALCFIELQNEDDIFFYTSEGAFNACPTYKKHFLERFAAWLKDRYGSAGETEGGLGRRPAHGRDAGGREHRAAAQPVVLRRGPPAGPEGRGAAAAARHGRLLARRSGPVLWPIRQGDPRRRLQGTAERLALAGAGHAAALLQPEFRLQGRLHRPAQLFRRQRAGDVRLDAHPSGQRLPRQRPAAGDRPAVRPVGVDSRLPERLRRGRAGHPGRLRHGPARLGRLLRVPVPGRPPGLRRHGRRASPGASGTRTCPRRWASSPRWPG